MRKRVIALVSNHIATDQRLIKVGNTLQRNGFDFHLIGTQHRGNPSLDHIAFSTHRVPIIFKKNFLFYAELQARLFWALLKTSKSDSIILANDLDTLLPARLVAKIYNIPLVADFHEIYTEMPSLKDESFQKKVWKFLERNLVPGIQHSYTVSQSYANWFEKEYGIQPKVIKNVPNNSIERVEVETATQPIIIYQGAMNPSRGIDKMILAMNYIKDAQLWLVGDGPIINDLKNLAKENQLEEKVKFLGRKNPEELKKITPNASLGLSLEEDNGLSYRYALPNKIFDYIQAGVPVLGSCDLPEMKAMISHYQIGEIIENNQPEHIAQKMQEVLQKGKKHYKENLLLARQALNWENQEQELLAIFKKAADE